MRLRITLVTLILFAAIAVAGIASAQGALSIPWSTVAGGGGSLAGDVFALSGSVGQAAASNVSGDSYAIAGGYWTGTAEQGSPTIYLPIVLR